MNNHLILLDIRQNTLAVQESPDDQHQPVSFAFYPSTSTTETDRHLDSSKVSGFEGQGFIASRLYSIPLVELPPPPKACFGRDELIEEIVRLAESLETIALIGAGGIGKTSTALAVLHDNRIKARFGDNRRFIRCDRFPASCAHFLARLSQVVGAGIDNPEDLTPLRPFLSSREMIIFLDNAESILDPLGTDAQKIYAVVEELSRLTNICLGITSRISTVPPHCRRPIIPTLSMESACDIFYSIYSNGGRSNIVNDLLQRLDLHPLSVTLLATTACHNTWDHERLAKEWDIQRAQLLRTDFNESLAAAIELSLTSPTFCKLGPHAREILGIVAFFPQGVYENDLDQSFSAIPDRKNIFDKFCVLSLTYRSNGFTTMLAPIRDYLCPRDPASSPLLCAIKDYYFNRLSVDLYPDKPGFGEARWIRSEDINVEHMLNAFTSITNSRDAWDACAHFMDHLFWYKPRPTVLTQKIEALPDYHDSKPECLFSLSQLFYSAGNYAEQKRILPHLLKLKREQGDDLGVARVLSYSSYANRMLGLRGEGIQEAKEALEIYGRHGDTARQAECLISLAWLLVDGGHLNAAEEAASRAIDIVLVGQGEDFLVCRSHRVLGDIYCSKGKREKAIHHYEVSLGIATPFNWHNELFWNHYCLAKLFRNEKEFNDAHAHVEQAKLHAVEDAYCMGRAMEIRAGIWNVQYRFGDATSDALRALEIYERLGATEDARNCRASIPAIKKEKKFWRIFREFSGCDIISYTC